MITDKKSYPYTKEQVLAIEYLRLQDTKDLSPVEFAKKYDCIYNEIVEYYNNLKSSSIDDFVYE